jgi:hypothetical protein
LRPQFLKKTNKFNIPNILKPLQNKKEKNSSFLSKKKAQILLIPQKPKYEFSISKISNQPKKSLFMVSFLIAFCAFSNQIHKPPSNESKVVFTYPNRRNKHPKHPPKKKNDQKVSSGKRPLNIIHPYFFFEK